MVSRRHGSTDEQRTRRAAGEERVTGKGAGLKHPNHRAGGETRQAFRCLQATPVRGGAFAFCDIFFLSS